MDGLLVTGDPNDSIIGIKYDKGNNPRHIVTYKTSYEKIDKSLEIIKECIDILDKKFSGVISSVKEYLKNAWKHNERNR